MADLTFQDQELDCQHFSHVNWTQLKWLESLNPGSWTVGHPPHAYMCSTQSKYLAVLPTAHWFQCFLISDVHDTPIVLCVHSGAAFLLLVGGIAFATRSRGEPEEVSMVNTAFSQSNMSLSIADDGCHNPSRSFVQSPFAYDPSEGKPSTGDVLLSLQVLVQNPVCECPCCSAILLLWMCEQTPFRHCECYCGARQTAFCGGKRGSATATILCFVGDRSRSAHPCKVNGWGTFQDREFRISNHR